MTSRAEMEWDIDKTFWTFEDKFHLLDPPNPKSLPTGRQANIETLIWVLRNLGI
jgi:hypothetical protein